MAHKGGEDHIQTGQSLGQRIVKDGGPAAQTLLQYQVFVPQRLGQQTGPALGFVETVTAVGAIEGLGAVAVGVGIAKTYDMLLHPQCPR